MQKDPSKIILFIAIVLMLVPASLIALLAINLSRQLSTQQTSQQASAYQTAPAQSSLIDGTVDLHPTFPPPGSKSINTDSSQPPTNGTPTFAIPTITPTIISTPQPTITPIPTSTPINSIFTIQIVSYPQQTNNNSVVVIQVRTGQPNAILQLNATYNVPPYFYQIGNQVTDPLGNTTIYWSINLSTPINHRGGNSTTAHFSITGSTPDGQVATSPTQSIQILLG